MYVCCPLNMKIILRPLINHFLCHMITSHASYCSNIIRGQIWVHPPFAPLPPTPLPPPFKTPTVLPPCPNPQHHCHLLPSWTKIFQGFQSCPKFSNTVQNAPNRSKKLQSGPNGFNLFKNGPKWLKILQNICSKVETFRRLKKVLRGHTSACPCVLETLQIS